MKKILCALLGAVMLLSACGTTISEDSTAEITDPAELTDADEPTNTSEVTEPVSEESNQNVEADSEDKVKRMDYKITVKDDAYVYNNDGTYTQQIQQYYRFGDEQHD